MVMERHFVHTTMSDFDNENVDDINSDETSPPWVFGPLDDAAPASGITSWEGMHGFSMVHEPPWFPPLELPSPLDEMLFMYYALEIVPRCTMYDDVSNGFRSVIIPMSSNHPAVMHSILAVAAFYQRNQNSGYEVVSLEQKEKSLIHARRHYFSDATPDKTYEELVAVAIMLCVFEIKDGSGPNWDRHLHGGRSILQSRVPARSSGRPARGIAWWANKFFAYQAINSTSTTIDKQKDVLSTTELWLTDGLKPDDVDGFMGCSSEMMALTAELIDAARHRYGHPDRSQKDIEESCDDYEHRLLAIRQVCNRIPISMSEVRRLDTVIDSFLAEPDILSREKILALTAEARRQATYVLFLVCVRGLPLSRTEAQIRVDRCVQCLSAICELMDADEAPSWGMSPVLWPLFIAGVSAQNGNHRRSVTAMFDKLRRSKCLGNIKGAREAVTSIWNSRDSGAGDIKDSEMWRLYVSPSPSWPLSLG